MGARDYYKHGDYNAICDVCGFLYKASELRKRWDGAMVCQEDWEPRHPQEFIRSIKETNTLPFTRTESEDTFTVVGDVDSLALNAISINLFHLG
jgi:hypothetical protein